MIWFYIFVWPNQEGQNNSDFQLSNIFLSWFKYFAHLFPINATLTRPFFVEREYSMYLYMYIISGEQNCLQGIVWAHLYVSKIPFHLISESVAEFTCRTRMLFLLTGWPLTILCIQRAPELILSLSSRQLQSHTFLKLTSLWTPAFSTCARTMCISEMTSV